MSIALEDVIIARAREILATKRAWTSSAEARTARGDRCLAYDSGAVRFADTARSLAQLLNSPAIAERRAF